MASQEYRYPDGSSYSGARNDKGHPHGFGALTLGDGTMFTGTFENGFFCGLGVLYFPDTTRYEGEFKAGKFNGFGTFYRPNLMRYEGEFKDGEMNGQGLITFPSGSHGLPRMEGVFQGAKLVKQEKCSKTIRRARDVSGMACNQSGSR